MKDILTKADKERISAAVAEAEGRTSGEIVPYIMPESGKYDIANWRGAFTLSVITLMIVLLIFQFYSGWGLAWLHTGWGTAFVTLCGGCIGAILPAILPWFKRFFAGKVLMTRMVQLRAIQAFVDEEVFNTRERTGILLFVSLLEHRIEVVGDAGINQRVSSDDWIHIVERIQAGIRGGRLVEGLIEAIRMCGDLLEKSGVEIRPDHINEISDAVRIRKDD